jgi:hypothetical protein
MKNPMELQLRQVALGLTALFAVQLLWSGMRLALQSDPEPIAPALATLQRQDILQGAGGEPGGEFVSRPLFWPGRETYQPSPGEPLPVEQQTRQVKELKNMKLRGVYAAGENSGIIVEYKDVQRRLKIDDTIDGWTFTMMSTEGAIFENGEESRVLELQHVIPAREGQRQRNARASRRAEAVREVAEKSDQTEEEED